ncbi:MAG TPA: antitoxin [Dermatophilaceae bacterium]|nr:antitoxin [Dermatophilaceae bacterium]
MGMFDSAKEKLTGGQSGRVEELSDQGLEKAGDLADEKTGGKFAGQVDQGQTMADGHVGDDTAGA